MNADYFICIPRFSREPFENKHGYFLKPGSVERLLRYTFSVPYHGFPGKYSAYIVSKNGAAWISRCMDFADLGDALQ